MAFSISKSCSTPTTDTCDTSSGSACCASRIGCTVAQQWPFSRRLRPFPPSAGSPLHSSRISSNSSSAFLSNTNFFGRPRFVGCAAPAPLTKEPRAKDLSIASSAGTTSTRSLHLSKSSRGLGAEGASSSSRKNGSNSSSGETASLAGAVLFLRLLLLLEHHHDQRHLL